MFGRRGPLVSEFHTVRSYVADSFAELPQVAVFLILISSPLGAVEWGVTKVTSEPESGLSTLPRPPVLSLLSRWGKEPGPWMPMEKSLTESEGSLKLVVPWRFESSFPLRNKLEGWGRSETLLVKWVPVGLYWWPFVTPCQFRPLSSHFQKS